ncbi:MAG: 50S ribosome-binding GTPase [Acidobacteria bacterium]|nr:50S ribosome-binding GTPase [Acidobacteriota bacterium]
MAVKAPAAGPPPRFGPEADPAAVPIVVLLGGAGTGKSALFNCLLGEPRSLVSEGPGTTRDLLAGTWRGTGRSIRFIDTPPTDHPGVEGIAAAAALVLLVTDARRGCTPADRDWAARVHRSGRPLLVVVNKAEGIDPGLATADFHGLVPAAFPIPVSAAQGSGIARLRDEILGRLAVGSIAPEASTPILTLAFVGRANTGKSTLSNRILGQDRSAVAENPGTTRDVVEGWRPFQDGWVQVLDTPGRGRRGTDAVLKTASRRTMCRLRECDVAALVLDATRPVGREDRNYLQVVHDRGRPVLVLANKMDRFLGDPRLLVQGCREKLALRGKPPILLVSALSGRGVDRILSTALRLARLNCRRVPARSLHRFLEEVRGQRGGDRRIVRHAVQVGIRPPRFLFLYTAARIPEGFAAFLENRLRRRFQLEEVPLRVHFRRAAGARGRARPGTGRRSGNPARPV